ncbi:MAG: hypothetical protein ABI947_04390 [Chloroflexota bacterium]
MSDEQIEALIDSHVQRYPELEILDVYKLLHQGVFGPGHAIKNQKAAREWLDFESKLAHTGFMPPLVENVHPEAALVRIHLHPYLAAGGDLHKLLNSFVQSSKAIDGQTSTLAAWWRVFQAATQTGGSFAKRFDARSVGLIGQTNAAAQWPATHHSPAFERTYKPTYRVLTRPIAETLLQQQKITFSVD